MGAYLAEPQTKKNTKEQTKNNIRFCSSEMQGWRKTMQDADIHVCDIGDGNSIFGVFDGHGGHQVSKYVEQIFVKTLINLQSYKKSDYQNALEQCFKLIDQIIQSQAGQRRLKQLRGVQGNLNSTSPKVSASTGCTANVVLITKDSYWVANIGDSRAALSRKENQSVQLSEDHKPDSQIQRTRIYNAGGQVMMGRVNGGLNLSRSFGDFDYKQNKSKSYAQQMITCKPDVKQFKRTKEDEFIIMGCDGIWQKYVEDTKGLVNLVKNLLKTHNNDYKKVIEQLLDTLIAKQTKEGVGCDNMTAILIGFL